MLSSSADFTRRVLIPTPQNVTAVPKTMATMLVKNSNAAPPLSTKSPIVSDMPEVAIGGTKAAAIATPGSAESKFGRLIAYAPATPLNKATNRSTKLGVSRLAISGLIPRLLNNVTSKPNNALIPNATAKPKHTDLIDVLINFMFACTNANPIPTKGVISGATNIAPMTTAAELSNNPNAAIMVESEIRETKSKLNDDPD